ncbi:hypothetical protein SLOPH_1108 [Spraguea lophii 42_110]|uniref:Uncharacterized protein n=1 Tax=Spraguea lophii (strain 42_110) TaxID=1358809 RepID=S7W9V7_SPRLO|nr:hypothetical protein SLOPH_1108 [Spraguea lophii 42_110]
MLIKTLLFQKISCSFLTDFYNGIEKNIDTNKQVIAYTALLLISSFLALVGIIFMKTSLAMLISISVSGAFYYISRHVAENKKVLFLNTNEVEKLINFVEKNKLWIGLLVLVISIILASILVFVVKSIIILGSILLSIYVYNEIFSQYSLLGIKLENVWIRLGCIRFVFGGGYFYFYETTKICSSRVICNCWWIYFFPNT